jgi:hypothetical protein
MPAVGEPLWLDEDRAWAMALMDVEADSCPDCRQPWSEATDPENEFEYEATLLRCHACTASATAVSAYQNSKGDSRGLHVSITKRG